ncbi:hypothetical protein J6TS7_53810 [Paenibacillus dendritiformis]|nr:hypothetical protein J6TS7_53810 [Paenibacillus dendritiformis]
MFATERIKLRKMTEQDISVYHKWRNTPEAMYWTNPAMDVYSEEETAGFVRNVILGSSASKNLHHRGCGG